MSLIHSYICVPSTKSFTSACRSEIRNIYTLIKTHVRVLGVAALFLAFDLEFIVFYYI